MIKVIQFILLLLATILSLKASSQEIKLQEGLSGVYFFSQENEIAIPATPSFVFKDASFTTNRFGEENSAVKMDGSKAFGLLPNADKWDFYGSENYSVSLWIHPRDNNSGCILMMEQVMGVKWNGLKNPLTAFFGTKNGYPSGKFKAWRSNEWYHIVLVKSRNKGFIYVNGSLDVTIGLKEGVTLDVRPIYFGKHPYFWGAFKGDLDDIIIFKRALNPYEVQTLGQIEYLPIEQMVSTTDLPDPSSLIGNWQGVLIQPDNSIVKNFTYWVRLQEIDETGILRGYTRIELHDKNAYGVSKARAFKSGNSLNFEEIQTVRQKNYLGYPWCKKFGQFVYNPKDKSLRGKWYASNCNDKGTIVLYKTENSFNHFDNRLSEKVSVEDLIAFLEKEKDQEYLKNKIFNIEFKEIIFSTGSSVLPPQEKAYITSRIYPILSKYKKVNLSIEGHTDNRGLDEKNLSLSLERAYAIYTYLIRLGIPEVQMSYIGFGEAKPIASNESESGRKQNRRVEFHMDIQP